MIMGALARTHDHAEAVLTHRDTPGTPTQDPRRTRTSARQVKRQAKDKIKETLHPTPSARRRRIWPGPASLARPRWNFCGHWQPMPHRWSWKRTSGRTTRTSAGNYLSWRKSRWRSTAVATPGLPRAATTSVPGPATPFTCRPAFPQASGPNMTSLSVSGSSSRVDTAVPVDVVAVAAAIRAYLPGPAGH